MIIKTDPRNIIIIVLVIVLFFSFHGCNRISKLFDGEEVIDVKTSTKIDTTITEKTFKDIQDAPEKFTPTKQKVEISKDGKIKPVPYSTPIDSTYENQVKEVNKYETVSELPNGTIKSTILTTGDLLSIENELTTKDATITKTTEIVRTVVKSGLFGYAGSTLGLDGRIKDISAGITYYHKNKWFLETGPQYDVDPKINLPIQDRIGVTVKIGFKF